MTTLAIQPSLEGRITSSPKNKVFLSAYICNMLEMYDFLITGMMFPYIAQLFFPLEDKISVLLAGSLTFLVGFLMRPVGGILFGYIGDTYGRKKALLLSIFGMAIATACIGLLPTYESISIFAPLLLVVLRSVQGLCIGGEGQGASVFVLEHYRGVNPGKWGGLLATSNGMAALLAFFISMFAISSDALEGGWRICYLFGASLGIVGLYLRSFIGETPAFTEVDISNSEKRIPIIKVLKDRKINMLNIILCVGIGICLTYTGFTFVNLFLSKILDFSSFISLSYAAFGTFLAMIAVSLGGRICDKLGLYETLSFSLLFIIFFIFPIHWLLALGEKWSILLSLFLLAVPTGGICGSMPHLVASSFSTDERYTGAAFSNNLGQALLGGVQPFLAIYLIKTTDILWSPAVYPCALACLYLIFIMIFRKKLTLFQYIVPVRRNS
ncbi:MAG: MFS transporter [Alphaproteobacteria bacterium]|nr:MFS transporter [Alphaproteobacteria bacterium]